MVGDAMNKAEKGAKFERKLANELVEIGKFPCVVRGASSKAYGELKIDIVAFDEKNSTIYIAQLKNHESKVKNPKVQHSADERKFYNSVKPFLKKWQVVPIYITKKNYVSSRAYILDNVFGKSHYDPWGFKAMQ